MGVKIHKNRKKIHARWQMDEVEDYRPLFTYWITFTQILIMVIVICLYGIASFDVELTRNRGHIKMETLTIEEVDYREPSNFWLGPRASDLIHLGANFSPCMRYDKEILDRIERDRKEEASRTGCCVRNDGSGCMQTTGDRCSRLLSTFYKWGFYGALRGPDHRVSGPVCGQDPGYCLVPASRSPYLWPDDVRKWPVCIQGAPNFEGAPRYLTCDLTARPCCVGIHGKCELRSMEYCNFVRGHFHPEANLCSQVSCLGDVCGLLSFAGKDSPDQVYRLWISLFLHAGILQLLLTVLVQGYLMRDLEKMCGPIRLAIIYFGSGIVGNTASAVFVPYRAESGPAGSQFGLLAALLVEVMNAWPILRRPHLALFKYFGIFCVLIFAGFLPWIDNYSHLFGFVSGFFLSLGFLPYLRLDNLPGSSWAKRFFYSRIGRIYVIFGSLCVTVSIFVILISIFYLLPFAVCEVCKYFSCIPLTDSFCADQNVDFEKSQISLF